MKYIYYREINDEKCAGRGIFGARSYFVPFSSRTLVEQVAPLKEVKASDRVFSLSGAWDLAKIEGKTKTYEFDTDRLLWVTAQVPSCIQTDFAPYQEVKGRARLEETKYVLRTFFSVYDESNRHFIRFDRVGGIFEVLINGIPCGYSTLGCGEFDVTGCARAGMNELVVVIRPRDKSGVFYEGNHTRSIGILGDVLLSVHPQNTLLDYSFESFSDSVAYIGRLTLQFTEVPGAVARVTLCDGDKECAVTDIAAYGKQVVEFRDMFRSYLPEDPYLYSVYVQIFSSEEKECTRLRVGFFDRKTEDEYMYCRHTFKVISCLHSGIFGEHGLLTAEEFEREIDALKSCHINTLQTDTLLDAEFVRLCTEKGMLLIEDMGFNVPSVTSGRNKKEQDAYLGSEEATNFVKKVCMQAAMRDRSAPALIGFAFLSCGVAPCFGKIAGAISLPSLFVLYRGKEGNCIQATSVSSTAEAKEIALSGGVRYFSPLAACGTISGAELDEYFGIVDQPSVIGGCLKEVADRVVLGQVLSSDGLFDETYSPKNAAIYCRYLLRPLQATLRENCFLDLFNVSYFKPFSCNVEVNLLFDKQVTKIRKFVATVPQRSCSTFDVNLGKIGPDRKLEIIYTDFDGNNIATEVISVYPIVLDPGRVEVLRCKDHTYTLHTFDAVDEENTLPLRADMMPCSSEKVCDKVVPLFTESDRVFDLSGEWMFDYLGSNIPVSFSSGDRKWETITVPGSWEENGYEPFRHVKGYGFDFSRDKTGKPVFDSKMENTAALYRKVIEIADMDFRYHIAFEHLSGAIQLYVNGEYVGCTSYRFAEFDLSEKLHTGQNEIIVVQYKRSRNSFLYERDGFAATGITGAVKLIKRRSTGLYDCGLGIRLVSSTYFVTAQVAFSEVAGQTVRLTVKKDGKVIRTAEKTVNGRLVTFEFSDEFLPYYNERPELYDLYFTVLEMRDCAMKETECTKIPVGMYSISKEAGVVFCNELPLKVRGIDYNTVYNGRKKLLTEDEKKKDILLIKRYGFNAMQTEIPSPELLKNSMETGMYVFCRIPVFTRTDGKYNIYNDPEYVARIAKIAEIERKRTALSGNVVGYIFDGDVSTEAARKVFEVLHKTNRLVVAGGNYGGMIGIKDPTIEKLMDKVNEALGKASVFLMSYAPSYGVGCADVARYEDMLAGTPCCMGGIMTQFVDDIIEDMGDNDAGLFDVDRHPSTGAEHIKYLYRKVTSELKSDSEIEIVNQYNFKDTSDLTMKLCLMRDGHMLSRTELNATVPPRSKRKFDIFIDSIQGDMYLNVMFFDKKSGDYLYTEQHKLSEKLQTVASGAGKIFRVDELPEYLDIRFDGGVMRFDKQLGIFTRYAVMGKEVLKPERLEYGGNSFNPNIERPFVRSMLASDKPKWETSIRDFSWSKGANGAYIDILVETSVNMNKKECFVIRDKYIVSPNGRIEVFSVINPMRRHLPHLDCFGKTLRLHNAFGNIAYYGLGDKSTYADMREGAYMGVFAFKVDRVYDDVRYVQECGNRMNVHYVLARDKEGDGIVCVAEQAPFEFRVAPNSDKEIEQAYKNRTKPEQSGVYLDINAFVSGYGSGKRGPAKKFTYIPTEYVLHFSVLPLFGKR